MWDYDHSSHKVILNVRGNRTALVRRRKSRKNNITISLLNRPRVIVLGIIIIALFFVFLREAKFVLAHNPSFKIRYIKMENTRLIDQASLVELLKIEDSNTIFGISAKEISQKLASDPDIESVSVEKEFPDTLKIFVNERLPYARFVKNGNDYYVDRNGIVLLRKWKGARQVPLVRGVDLDNIVHGEYCSNKNLNIALDIQKSGDKNRLADFLEINEIDTKDINRIVVDTRERITVIMKNEDIEMQVIKLVKTLQKIEDNQHIISKVDLRFRDVYVE